MKIAVAELMVRFMERLGVSHVFGMPGAHILPVYDRLRDSRLSTLLVKHEQGAAFMAGGHARASGRIGACVATAGPGATNLVTGVANAFADRLPVLVVTGETSTYIFGKGGLQEGSGEGGSIDQAGLFKGITRYCKVVERTDYLPQVLRLAAQILLAPSSGPVLLSIPYNIQKELVDADILDGISFVPPRRTAHCAPAAAEELARMLAAARHPVMVAGHGCVNAGAGEALARLGARFGIPVATSLKGKGIVDENGALSLGCLGVTSDGIAYRYIVDTADLVILLGAGFNERTSYLWDARLLAGKKIVQVDQDAEQLEKVFKADLAIEGDIRAVLEATLACLPHAPPKALDKLEALRASDACRADPRFAVVRHFLGRLGERFARDAVIFDDNILFAENFFKAAAPVYFPNSGISSLGHALPAAIGARVAGERPAFAILGDGGFQMCCMELMTAVNYRIPVNAVVINNQSMGLIRKNQAQLYGERFIDCDFANPDYALLAKAFGIGHFRIESAEDVDRLFAEGDFGNAINLIEIMLDKNAFPRYVSDR